MPHDTTVPVARLDPTVAPDVRRDRPRNARGLAVGTCRTDEPKIARMRDSVAGVSFGTAFHHGFVGVWRAGHRANIMHKLDRRGVVAVR